MQTAALILSLTSLVVVFLLIPVCLRPRISTASTKRLQELELHVTEVDDSLSSIMRSLKKLHGRNNTRDARELSSPPLVPSSAGRAVPGDDPLARRPGESGDSWKTRVNQSLFNQRRM